MTLNKKKIFIIGNGHSGTTILYGMLAYHPDLAWFCQYSQRQEGSIPGRFALPMAASTKRVLRRVLKHDWRKGIRHYLTPRPGEMNSLWTYLWSIEDPSLRKKKMAEIVESELDSWGLDALLIKNPWIGQYVEMIQDALDDGARFIHIVRDGRAVVHSILHKHQRYHEGHDALVSAVNYWTRFLEKIILFGESVKWNNILEVRYEDLVANIPETLEGIMKFCDLDLERFPFDVVPGQLRATNPKWINEKNAENIRFIEENAGEILKRYRYI